MNTEPQPKEPALRNLMSNMANILDPLHCSPKAGANKLNSASLDATRKHTSEAEECMPDTALLASNFFFEAPSATRQNRQRRPSSGWLSSYRCASKLNFSPRITDLDGRQPSFHLPDSYQTHQAHCSLTTKATDLFSRPHSH